MKNRETILSPESEIKKPIETRVVLEFMRHGKKEKADKPDEKIRLTPEGRAMATARGKELTPQADVSIAFGSPRERAQETAGRVMLAGNENVGPESTLEEMQALIKKELSYGKKIASDPRLNFIAEESDPVGKAMLEAYAKGRLMDFLIHESDELAKKTGDTNTTTYSREAANVAEIVEKYLNVGNNFERIAKQNPEDYKKSSFRLERYLGTHQSVGESFVAKLLENTQGVAERDGFIKALGPGFAETAGFKVEIKNSAGNQEAVVSLKIKDKEWKIPLDSQILEQIIQERI